MSDELFRALRFRGPHEAKQVSDLALHLNTDHGGGPVAPVVKEIKRKPLLKRHVDASDKEFISELMEKSLFEKLIPIKGLTDPNAWYLSEPKIITGLKSPESYFSEGHFGNTFLSESFEKQYKECSVTELKVGDKVLVTDPGSMFKGAVCTISKLNAMGHSNLIELNDETGFSFDKKWLTKQEDFAEFGTGLGLATTKPEGAPNWQVGNDCILNKPVDPYRHGHLLWSEGLNKFAGSQLTVCSITGDRATVRGMDHLGCRFDLIVSLDWLTPPETKQRPFLELAINEYNTILMYSDARSMIRVYFDVKPRDDIRTELKRAGFKWYALCKYWVGTLGKMPDRYDDLNIRRFESDYKPEFPNPF